MHHALRSSLTIAAVAAAAAASTGCQTHDRRIYTTHADVGLHTPNPFAPSTSKAAEDATSSIGASPGMPESTGTPDSANPSAPGSPEPVPQ